MSSHSCFRAIVPEDLPAQTVATSVGPDKMFRMTKALRRAPRTEAVSHVKRSARSQAIGSSGIEEARTPRSTRPLAGDTKDGATRSHLAPVLLRALRPIPRPDQRRSILRASLQARMGNERLSSPYCWSALPSIQPSSACSTAMRMFHEASRRLTSRWTRSRLRTRAMRFPPSRPLRRRLSVPTGTSVTAP